MKRNQPIRAILWPLAACALIAMAVLAYLASGGTLATDKAETPAAPVHSVNDGHNHAAEAAQKTPIPPAGSGAAAAHDHAAEAASEVRHDRAAEKPAALPAGHSANDGHDHGGEAATTEAGHAGEAATTEAGHAGEGEAHADEVALTSETIRQNGIRLVPARKQALGETFTVPGRISYNAEAMAQVGTPVQGRVAEIKVKQGDLVRKGDVLLVIDSPVLGEAQSDFLQKRTQVEAAASAMEVAQNAAERAKRLLEGKGIAFSEYQRREGEYKSALGTHRAAQAAVTAAENALHLWGVDQDGMRRLIQTGEIAPIYTVRAPIAGRVIQRDATLGEVVGPDRKPLLALADMKTLWVLAEVPENKVGKVALGARAGVTVDALSSRTFNGKVTFIAMELSKETRTVQVRVEIEDGRAPIKPGMFAQVHLQMGNGTDAPDPDAVVVPDAAVLTYEGGPVVFVEPPGEPGTFASRPVKIGPSNGIMVPILEGLEEGTRVVVDGAFVLKAEFAKGIMEGKT